MPYVVQAYEPSGGDAMSKTAATRKDALAAAPVEKPGSL
jgi:hypothetical protein